MVDENKQSFQSIHNGFQKGQVAETSKEQMPMCRPYRKRTDHAYIDPSQEKCGRRKNGRWSLMEHVRFLESLKLFGKNWKKVQEYVVTRTST
jgi:Myb-like DNA-binding domain